MKIKTFGRYEHDIERLKPWFHNIHLPDGSQTYPDHFFGDFPNFKWKQFRKFIPKDLNGMTALDIGCNAGFYSFELAKRGAKVLGIDLDAHYLKQAQWACKALGLNDKVKFRQMQVYDLSSLNRKFDIVIFMGVLYHLRYPLLAIDIVAQKVRDILIFQTLTIPDSKIYEAPFDLNVNQRKPLLKNGWPKMSFIEHRLNGDPTNWWAPNHSAIISMFRTCGMEAVKNPGHEIYIFKPSAKYTSVPATWNRSEYLSATGKKWQGKIEMKTGKRKAV
jgi:tRNA (mo5U34)-methyltransferase